MRTGTTYANVAAFGRVTRKPERADVRKPDVRGLGGRMATQETALAKRAAVLPANQATAIENALLKGDLKDLTPEQRLGYYKAVCESVGLNPLTKPFEYMVLNGKLILYAKRDATDQLRKIHGVSVEKLEKVKDADLGLYIVTANVKDASGRLDTGTGAVNIAGLKAEALANAIMKAETKAKRRATLSICGLGLLDESELDSTSAVITDPSPELIAEGCAQYEAQVEASQDAFKAAVAAGALNVQVEVEKVYPPKNGFLWFECENTSFFASKPDLVNQLLPIQAGWMVDAEVLKRDPVKERDTYEIVIVNKVKRPKKTE